MKQKTDRIPTAIVIFLLVWGIIASGYAIHQSLQVDELKDENDQLNQTLWDMKIIQNNIVFENEKYESQIEDIWDYQRENPPLDVGLFIWAIENTKNETIINLLCYIITNIEPTVIPIEQSVYVWGDKP